MKPTPIAFTPFTAEDEQKYAARNFIGVASRPLRGSALVDGHRATAIVDREGVRIMFDDPEGSEWWSAGGPEALRALALLRSPTTSTTLVEIGFFPESAEAGYPEPAAHEAPPFPFAIIAHTPKGRLVWRGLPSREAAEARRYGDELRRVAVCEIMPEVLADILARMYDDEPDEWDADVLDDVEKLLDRGDFDRGGVSLRWLAEHARSWPPAEALLGIAAALEDRKVEWGVARLALVEQVLIRHGFVPRPNRRMAGRR